MKKIDFKKNKYDTDLIIGTFGLELNTACEILADLLNVNGNLTAEEQIYLEEHRARLAYEGSYWNEEELKMHFISHVFYVARIDVPKKLKLFYERTLKETVEGHEIHVKCDCMIATPFSINIPKAPYFFLEEFKKAKKPDDPEGQMLLAMIAAQQINDNEKPVYGCWLQGKDWNFTTLHGKKYCKSKTLDATDQEDLFKIILILRNLRQTILGYS